jgi:hypothetical protein
MDGLVPGYLLIEFIRVDDRAVFDTGGTPSAVLLDDVSRFLDQGDRVVSRFPFDPVDFRVGQDLDVDLPVDLDQFRR